MVVKKFVSHSRRVTALAISYGWLPAARYTNLRDVRFVDRLGFLDIDWRKYNFAAHLDAARSARPLVTVARDVESVDQLTEILDQAEELAQFAEDVIVVPKDPCLTDRMELIPSKFVLGYSVPTRYGKTPIPPSAFNGNRVHLLGGRPDVQRLLANSFRVVSLDCNRFTLDAAYGDYFDGHRFRPHPFGGYERCLDDSLRHITAMWDGYLVRIDHGSFHNG